MTTTEEAPIVSFMEIDGVVLSGEEFEEYCKNHGLCRRCAKVRTHRRALKLFGRGKKWEPLTTHDEETGDYIVYKGYCLQPTCYTIGQAKRLLGESGNKPRKSTRRQRIAQRFKRGKKKKKTTTNPETGSVRSVSTYGDDNSSIASGFSGFSGFSGWSNRSGFSRRSRKKSSAASTASSVSSYGYSDDGSLDSGMTPMPGQIEPGRASPIVQHRVEQLVTYDYFTVLDLSKVELRQEDVSVIVVALRQTKTLESVVMDKCKLKDDGLEQVAEALAHSLHLRIRKVSLRQNSIGNKGAMSFYNFLLQSQYLEELDMSENNISSRGAVAILTALNKNSHCLIRTLNLAQNEIWDMDDGSFLRTNATLKIFNLDGNFMHDEGAEQIASAIAENPKSAIERLYLGWNGISDDGAQALAKLMEVNSTLQVLGLAENDISNSGARAILSSLAVNTSVREISGLYHNQIDRKFIIVAIKRLLHRYGERSQQIPNKNDGSSSNFQQQLQQQPEKAPEANQRHHAKATDDNSSEHSESSLNWAAQLYSNEDEEKAGESSNRRTSVALEAIEHWDWGTFGIEEIEAAGSQAKAAEQEVKTAVATKPPEVATPQFPPGTLPTDRLTVFQSAPLAYFNRLTTEHHAVPLLDFDYEARSLKDALRDTDALGANIGIEFENATTDRFSVFFSHGGSRIMHFSGHGHPECLAMENGFGYMQALPVEDLRRFVAIGGGNVRVVLVSACHSQSVASTFLEAGVPHVVCCHQDTVFRDYGAIEFAKHFYRELARNKTLKEAFHLAVDGVRRSPLVKSARNLGNKFKLLPEKPDTDPYHEIKVFFQSAMSRKREVVLPDTSLVPRVPVHFVGREVDMYEILESLRVDDVVRVGGPPGCGKASVVAAVSRYVLQRPKSFLINSVFWLPTPPGIVPEAGSLYDDLCKVIHMLMEADDDLWDDKEYSATRDRILAAVDGKRIVLVLDGRNFSSEASGENLETFLSHLLNEASVKIVLITASESRSSASKTSRSRSEETIIHIGSLDFKASALLFGNSSKFVSSSGCSIAHTAEEFASFLAPPSIAKMADGNKHASRRQKDLYKAMGSGNPATIIATAASMSESDFNELVRTAQRPDVRVDSAGALESEILERTAQKDKAVRGKNFLRAQDLVQILDELEALRPRFPTLIDLMSQERAMKRELAEALASRKYDQANSIKRKLLSLKKKIMKEKSAQPSRTVGTRYTAGGKLQELQAQMNSMLAMAEKMNMEKSLTDLDASQALDDDAERATFSVSRQDHNCTLTILYGSVAQFDYDYGLSGIVCWTNENCDLMCSETGRLLLEAGGQGLSGQIAALPLVSETQWGPVKCGTGQAVAIGPQAFSRLKSRYVILAVSPLSPSNDDDDWDGDENRDEDALHFLEMFLRSSYRACFRRIDSAGLEAVAFPTITTKETGGTYEKTLRVGLQTLVEESKFSDLKDIHLVASSQKEARVLIKMAVEMGLECHPENSESQK